VFTDQRVVVVRHGETAWSRAGRHTGRSDIPLTEHGREQAQRLREALAPWVFAAVFTSPLQRAYDTCRLAGYGDRAVADPDLQEWDYGAYEGRTSDEILAQRPGWRLFRDGVVDGESLDAVAGRAQRVIERVRGIDGDVLLFAHGHILRVLSALWLEFPAIAGERLFFSAAAHSVLGYEREWTALLHWNIDVE
jgi:broad specificity phosphatase PhoE